MKRLAPAVAFMLVAGAGVAAPFQNGSFETGGVVPCNIFNVPSGSTLITGWTISTGNIDWLGSPPGCGWQPSAGVASLDLVGASVGGIGGIQQTFDTVPGTTYVLAFDLAGNIGAPPVIKPLAVTINGATSNFTFDITGHSGTDMGWVTRSINFVAAGTSSTVNFVSDVSASGGTLNAGAALDNVRVTPLSVAGATSVPLDWAHWVAILAIMIATGVMVLRRRRG
jgi:choice-of-anchor C domain-containing protein